MNIKINKWKISTLIGATFLVGVGLGCNTATTIHKTLSQKKDGESSLQKPVTQENLLSYENQVVDKYAAKLNWYNQNYAGPSNQVNIDEQISIMKNDFASYIPQNTTRSLNDDLQDKYGHVCSVGKELGIDVVDTYSLNNDVLPQQAAKLQSALVSQGDNDPTTEVNEYKASVKKIINRAEQHMWTKEEYGMRLAQSEATKTLALKYNKKFRVAEESDLQQALTILQNDIGKTLKVKEGDSTFTNKVKDYASNGVYDNQIEINPADFKDLFTFDYDITTGADLGEDYFYDATIPSIARPGEYANIKWTQTQDFGKFNGIDCTLIPGEFIPGYLAHIRIIGKDVLTDSHKCSLKLQFGVSDTVDKDHVLWSDLNQKTEVNGEEKINGVVDVVSSTNEEQIKYISKNTYYHGLFNSFTINLDQPDDKGRYFVNSIKNRAYIDVVIQNAWVNPDNSEYDFANHPLYIPIEEIKQNDVFGGLPIPIELQPYWDDTSKQTMYTNQTFALKISGESTDNEWLEYQWCIVDSISGVSNDYFSVKDIPWNIDGQLVDKIKVAYALDEDIKNLINVACQDILLFLGYDQAFEAVKQISDETYGLIEEKFRADFSLNFTIIVLTGACLVIQVTLIVLVCLGFATAIKDLVIGIISCALMTTIMVFSAISLSHIDTQMGHLKTIRNACNTNSEVIPLLKSFIAFIGTYEEARSPAHLVQSDKASIPARKQAATDIENKKEEIMANPHMDSFLNALKYTEKDIKNLKSSYFKSDDKAYYAATVVGTIISSIAQINYAFAGVSGLVPMTTYQITQIVCASNEWMSAEMLGGLEVIEQLNVGIRGMTRAMQGVQEGSQQYQSFEQARQLMIDRKAPIENQITEARQARIGQIVEENAQTGAKATQVQAIQTLSTFAVILTALTIALSVVDMLTNAILSSHIH